MNRTVRKLLCLCGRHEYRDKNLKSVCIAESYHYAVYRMSNRCVWCGKEYAETVKIPYMNGG